MLATITINLLTGDNNILSNAVTARETYSNASEQESNRISNAESLINAVAPSKPSSPTVKEPSNIFPEDSLIDISSTEVDASLALTVNATITLTDNVVGINSTSSRWVCNTESTSIGTNSDLYTGGNFSESTTITIPFEQTTESTTYYLHILSVNNDGNSIETISNPISVTPNYHEHEGSEGTTANGCYTELHTHSDSCGVGVCGGQYYCVYGSHYVHACKKCGFQISNYLYADQSATAGQTCTSHYPSCTQPTGYGCEKNNGTYYLGCEKDETVIDSYSIVYNN